MEYRNTEIYAVLKLGTHNIMGKVNSISNGQITLQPLSGHEIPLWSFHQLDVFTNRHIFFRNLPVVVVSDNKNANQKPSWDMTGRKLKVRYHNSEVAEIIRRIMVESRYAY